MNTEMPQRIWVAITAYKPMERLSTLLRVISEYEKFPYYVNVTVFIDYDSQEDLDFIQRSLNLFKKVRAVAKVAAPEYAGWYLTWAHKQELTHEVLNRRYDYYIYQENDMVLTLDNFHYWLTWSPRLKILNMEPGFIRYEEFDGKKVPFDNHLKHHLLSKTPNVWDRVGFTVHKQLVIDHEVKLFAQPANPYYGAMILDQDDAVRYVRSKSCKPEESYELVGIRNWPLADRSSMGLAFEYPPVGLEHRRFVPLVQRGEQYEPMECCLIKHDDYKYAPELERRGESLIDCSEMFVLQ